MTQTPPLSPAELRARVADAPKTRNRDLAESLGQSEAALIAAHVGHCVTRIDPNLDRLMPLLSGLGEVMALTRNDSCVIEKVGIYENFHSGQHAAMILNEAIDLRMFPSHWVSAFAVEAASDTGTRRSIQIFDAAGDAVHKIHLRDGSNLDQWQALVAELALETQSDRLDVSPRQPVEAPRQNPEKAEILRKEWQRMTDTHQFLRLTSKLKMNRLGAYHTVGAPLARQLAPGAADTALSLVATSGIEVMIFVGNRGCIEIHGGPIHSLKQMGPWLNVLDPEFNLHLRSDHIAETWAVTKPTQRGDAISIESFDAQGGLIFQIFGRATKTRDSRPEWNAIVADLPSAAELEVV